VYIKFTPPSQSYEAVDFLTRRFPHLAHESAKNLVNRLLKDEEKARIFSKQETDRGIVVGVSTEVQDEILKKKYRTTPNDSANDSHDSPSVTG
jgi:hypothetical protein